MDLKLVVMVMMLVMCVTSKPASPDSKTVQLLKSVLETLSKKRPGNKPQDGNNPQDPKPVRPKPPTSSDTPVSIEDLENFGQSNKDFVDKLVQILEESADTIEEESKGTDREVAAALRNFIKKVMELEIKESRRLMLTLMDLVSRSEAFGFLSEAPCASREECKQQEEDWEKIVTDVSQEVAQDLAQKIAACGQEAPTETKTLSKKKGKSKGKGNGKGSNKSSASRGEEEGLDELVGFLELVVTNKGKDNEEAVKPIVQHMRCSIVNFQELSDWIQTTWFSGQTTDDVAQHKADVFRLVMYGHMIREHFTESLKYVQFIEFVNRFNVVTMTDLGNAYEQLGTSFTNAFVHYGEAEAALVGTESNIHIVLENVARHVVGMQFDFWSTKMDVERWLANMVLLGFENFPTCAESFAVETFDEFATCVKDKLASALEEAKDEKEKMEESLDSGAANCDAIRGHLDSTYEILMGLEGGSNSAEMPSESEILEVLRQVAEFDGTVDLLRTDLECMGTEMMRFIGHIDFTNPNPVETFFRLCVVLDYMSEITEIALHHIVETAMMENLRIRFAAIVQGSQKKLSMSVQQLTKNMQSSLDKLKTTKLTSLASKGFLGLDSFQKSNDNDSGDDDDVTESPSSDEVTESPSSDEVTESPSSSDGTEKELEKINEKGLDKIEQLLKKLIDNN